MSRGRLLAGAIGEKITRIGPGLAEFWAFAYWLLSAALTRGRVRLFGDVCCCLGDACSRVLDGGSCVGVPEVSAHVRAS